MTSMEIVAIKAKSTQNLQARHTSKSTQRRMDQCLMTHACLLNRTLVVPEDRDKQLCELVLIAKLDDDWSRRSINQLARAEFVKFPFWWKRMYAWNVAFTKGELIDGKGIFQVGASTHG